MDAKGDEKLAKVESASSEAIKKLKAAQGDLDAAAKKAAEVRGARAHASPLQGAVRAGCGRARVPPPSSSSSALVLARSLFLSLSFFCVCLGARVWTPTC